MILDLPALFDSPRRRSARTWMARCPAHDDRSPSLSITQRGDRWLLHCFAGCTTGDVLYALGLTWDAVLRGRPDSYPQRSRRGRRKAPRPRCSTPPRYADPGDVQALWDACEPVDAPRDEPMYAAEWLYIERRIHPAVVARRDLARVLTRRTPLPPWARCGRQSWYATGHRLILPVFDHRGELRGVRARGVLGHAKKELAPQGVGSSGLVFADSLGRHLLREGGTRNPPCAWPDPVHVVVCEGAPDFLTWATTTSADDPKHPAVLGIASGAWQTAIADRIPDGATVLIDTDDDDAGRRYASEVARSLAGRCDVRRHQPAESARW